MKSKQRGRQTERHVQTENTDRQTDRRTETQRLREKKRVVVQRQRSVEEK